MCWSIAGDVSLAGWKAFLLKYSLAWLPASQLQLMAKTMLSKIPLPATLAHEQGLLETIWLLFTSVLVVPAVCKIPGGSPVLGFLAGGALIGPHALGASTCACAGQHDNHRTCKASRHQHWLGITRTAQIVPWHVMPMLSAACCITCTGMFVFQPFAQQLLHTEGALPTSAAVVLHVYPAGFCPEHVPISASSIARHCAGRGGRAAPGGAGRRVPAVQHRAGAVAGAAALDAEVRLRPGRPAGWPPAVVSAGMTFVALWHMCNQDAATVTASEHQQLSTHGTSVIRSCHSQVLVSTAVIAATVSALAAVHGPGAIILGGGLALSSTAVAMQVPCCAGASL
jgi:hypothetical protein